MLEFKMKVFITFALLPVFLSGLVGGNPINPEEENGANMKYFLVDRHDGTYEVEDLENSVITIRASASDLTYHFFSQQSPSSATVLKSTEISVLANTAFSPSKDTIFIIHGWRSNSEGDVNTLVRQALLPVRDINVFVVDWSEVADANYLSAQSSVVAIGEYVAAFIRSLEITYGLPAERVACAGHSLGAHVCGNAGAVLNGRLHHIVGLDPAGPLFTVGNINNRVDPSDAQLVQIIHTNGGLLGFAASIGHSDYFPNGGRSQPGCGLDIAGSCAHSRVNEYYAESIKLTNNLFTSRECSSLTNYRNGRCDNNQISFMGGYGIDANARGDFYLETNATPLYAEG